MAGVGAEQARAAKVQDALFRIAELASAAQDMQEFYRAIHEVVGELMPAKNFFIALYDEQRQLINWPYYIDENETDIPDPNRWDEFGSGDARGVTAYVLRTGQPQHLSAVQANELIESGEMDLLGRLPEDAVLVPLKDDGRTVGVLLVQSYTKDVRYTEQDKDLLAFVGQHVGAALSRARAIEETRQRNAELALINSVQEAIAGELDQQAIYDVVGDRIQEIFDAQGTSISILDEATGVVSFPYLVERGERLWPEPRVLSGGFTKHVLETGEPLLIEENLAAEAERFGSVVLAGEMGKSLLWVPLITGGRASGVISLDNFDREHAFDEGDVRLLTTLAGSLSVALENARLVHETRQRNAELALINSVQEALAGELEMQAIYDVVGDKIQEIFDAQVVDIGIFDFAAGLISYPYTIERGVRFPEESGPITSHPTTRQLLETKAAVLVGDVPARDRELGTVSPVAEGTERPLSMLFVPLVSGDEVRGRISLQNLDRTNAFTESDVRLLTTLAGGLSVALENARLVHETRQRNAELALINSVQEALAGELEMQAIYDVVGDKIQEIFDAQVVDIGMFDFAAGLIRYPYAIERGARFPDKPTPIERSPSAQELIETKAPVVINDVPARERERGVLLPVMQGEPALSVLFAPLIFGNEARGHISLQNLDRTNAFSDNDVRLLTTLAGSLSVALENARLVHETRQRNAELALINSVQEAIAGELDSQAIYDAVGDRIRDVFDAQAVEIDVFDETSGLVYAPYNIERGVRFFPEPFEPAGFSGHVLATRETLLINEGVAEAAERYGAWVATGEAPKSVLYVPLVAGGTATGAITLQNIDREHAFSESDRQLLETLAGSLSVALENARLVHETRQRNAELALINSVQDALAGELELQAIYDAVGERIRDVFDAQVVGISLLDEATGLLHDGYLFELGERLDEESWAPSGFSKHVLEARESLLIAEDAAGAVERYGSETVGDSEMSKSVLFVPLVVAGKATGVISLQNVDREHAFGPSDQQLLETLAGSLSVALENARLVHETRQRNAELALINSVQDAIAGELEPQAIYDAVGDRIREIFDAQVVSIRTQDEATGLLHFPYIIERGERLQGEPMELGTAGFSNHVLATSESLLIAENMDAEAERYGSPTIAGSADTKSLLFVPLVTGGKATGLIALENIDREHAFGESDEQLLETLAGSLSVALQNARLVHETRQRNAELALINSVQDSLAGELELQAIYDAVGDRIRDVFDAEVVDIAMYDETSGLIHFPYAIERGERSPDEAIELMGFRKHAIEARQSLRIDENLAEVAERYGNPLLSGEMPKSVLYVPLVISGKATGVISLQSIAREHAYTDSDQQLLETLAGSLSVALENARLVHETRQRNAELALINSVQEAIAGELDQQAIYDVVGDRIRELFDAQVVAIRTLDPATGLVHAPYIIERGERLQEEPMAPVGFSKHVLETRESVLVCENLPEVSELFGSPVLSGVAPKSVLFVPLIAGGTAIGTISLQNIDREHAFTESDQQLLETLAGSLSVALENARLVHETRQRNAELALINGVQDAIAGELEPQAIYDAVGDRIRDVFDAQAVFIMTLDSTTGLFLYPYGIERGERFHVEPQTPAGFAMHVLDTQESLLVNEDVAAVGERYGSITMAGEAPKSVLFVPLITGGKATGVISLQNVDREHAFSASDQQLLDTLAGSLSVALENARLVHETRQRNAELALITSVQDAIAGELDARAIYDAVGDRIRDVFDAQVVSIATLDEATGLAHYPYLIERDERLQAEPRPLAGFAKHVLETREPLLLTENLEVESERYGSRIVAGEMPKSVLFVPLVAGGKATAVISLQNIDREHAFDLADQQLLTTVAGSVSVALENARLVNETRQRVSELATVNSVGQALSSELELDGLIELVGERVRETFDADIAYVALHDEAVGKIEFAYYWESGERRPETPLPYGEGLTSQILESRAPILLNRKHQLENQATVGTPSLSYLGVPILVGSKAIGAISVQSIEEEGRFGEADARLLATIAANVGIAMQNARLFTEVEHQRGYLESLVSITPAAVVVIDTDEVVTEWNPAAAELFGYSAEEAVGRSVDELVFGSSRFDTDEGREITQEARTTGRAQRITRRRRRDGTLVDVELMLVPLSVDGSHVGFLCVYHDVTELQRARQEAEAATQAKSAFLATMSHEIRTPMNAVIGMTDLLLGTELTPEQREFAEVVHSSGDLLLHVIDDILDYSKIEAGKLDLEQAPFNLRDAVEGALDIVAPRAWEKELELGCLIDDEAPAGVVGDEARLRQVLLNLLSNAVKFTERGEVMVLVNAEKTGEGSHRIELAVRDTGIGIPADRMNQLFTSFSQVDASTTRRFGGTGLGLAISKRLVELMGGTIAVDSEQGSGSTFRISLPVTAADVPAKIPFDDGLPHLAGKRILIVDDNATNREIVTRHARSWGMEPVALEFPAAALELIGKGEPFAVAVLDMMMPDMDGLALAGEIRQHRSESELPLLLLTSLGRLPQLQSKGVFSAQLSKPLKASQLYNMLVQLLTAGKAGEEAAEPAADGKRARSALRILLAEDNAMNQKVALRLLERLGYGADVATNGLEAIDALERKPYDVVLMDVQMPELDGLDATRTICERWPVETRPHIIAMTANALPEDREACFAAGMNDYVAKPIRAEELAAALKRAKPLSLNGESGSDTFESITLDDGALQNLRQLGGDDFLGEVIDAFLADAPGLLTTLRRSLDDGSTEELRRAAHTLKSNGATLGAEGFAELCRTLEQRAKAGELDDAAELVDRIETEYQPLEEALAALRAGATS
ncbi:MAG: GAF domain-containing protein [Gaiellaceae bacterium]